MKRLIIPIVFVFILMLGITASAEDVTMKIAMSGETKYAKDVGTGKGISFTLPELDTDEFYIYAIELAVFERQNGEDNWHIFVDDDGEESKKEYIENPKSLTFNVNFGDLSVYRDKAKYKIAYRYYVQSVADTSKLLIAGEDVKDGWRLVGEDNPVNSSDEGFAFYKNSAPTVKVTGISYLYYTLDAPAQGYLAEEELFENELPKDAFDNGILIHMDVDDFDTEDILTASYILEDAITDELAATGTLDQNGIIRTDYKCRKFRLYIEISDNFGAVTRSEPVIILLDLYHPTVESEFNDGGYALKGKNLFSDFYINDDLNTPMEFGSVYALIYQDDVYKTTLELEYVEEGRYRLDETNMRDGTYRVELKIYDKAGNESEHTFTQKLDNTAPTIRFITPSEDEDATEYSKWTNESKYIMFESSDAGSGGIKSYRIYLNGSTVYSASYTPAEEVINIKKAVSTSKTGKLEYIFNVYDDAKPVDKERNRYTNSSGNVRSVVRYVWLDKTKPTITTGHIDDSWKSTPYMMYANFNDYPSSNGVEDVSGVEEKFYCITRSLDEQVEWKAYKGQFGIIAGGVYYVHFKATDNAGNEEVTVHKLRVNRKPQILDTIRPTDDSNHTIYYGTPGFYVVKNTAYNTKFHFGLRDADTDDAYKITAKLVSKDNSDIFATSESSIQPTGNTDRDIVFNIPYVDSSLNELPDGVYDMYVTVTEIKIDGEEIVAFEDINDCEIVIKRNAPPTPVINSEGGTVTIVYPDEPLSGSLNNNVIKSHYKCQYKTVKDGEAETNTYRTYTGSFDADNFIVTALYTDIAGNTSIATKRIYKDADDADDILTGGNTITVEESRIADVYYIGIRRDKKSGIDNSVFDYIE